MIDQKCHEWGNKMWAATIDFTKAFDSIIHKSIGDALKSCNIGHDYIRLLKKLDRDQKATVLTDEESDMLEIKKGTKQGEPLSSVLFNTVLQKALEEDIPRWQKKRGMGTHQRDNDHDCLTNMKFADNILPFSILKRTAPKNGMRIQAKYRKKWDSESIQERRKFSAPKARTSEKKLRLTTSKSQY